MRPHDTTLTTMVLSLVLAPAALASTWYVNGVSGSDSNNCLSSTAACKTIGHAISLAASGDTIIVAAATYSENLTIGKSLNIIGSGAGAPIIDGRSLGTVVTISNAKAHVTLSTLIIRNGLSSSGGGIYNIGTLTIKNSTLSGNRAVAQCSFPPCFGTGGGIFNSAGTLAINNSTLSGNSAGGRPAGLGGGIYNHFGALTISNSTLSSNSASGGSGSGSRGGGIYNAGALTINNGTLSGNSAGSGGGFYGNFGSAALQNSIVANSPSGGDCSGTITSHGYNLSSDNSCDFDGTGDLNNINPVLGTLGNYGGPTHTIPLLSGSPAIDAGNPSGCLDGQGQLVKTDQRGMPRPDKEDSGGCDMGAYERQTD